MTTLEALADRVAHGLTVLRPEDEGEGVPKSRSAGHSASQPSPAPVSTTVSWHGVVGARLEELLYGLLNEMGAQDLIWRAGSNKGVTSADSGRDIEAVFSQPSPDGSVELTR